MTPETLPLPPHFDRWKVDEVWRVPYEARAADARSWAKEHGLRPAAEDAARICLMLVDCQNTFCIPGFELFVAGRSGRGAVEDNVRLCEFIYRNLGRITEITATLDTHRAMQIFHPVFWVNEAGEHPVGGQTILTPEDVERGVWRVNPGIVASMAGHDYDFLRKHALHYVRRLSRGGKYPLMIWPYHAMLGGIGHPLVSAVEEALFFHCLARQSQTGFEVKGDHPLTESYSVLGPEVTHTYDGEPLVEPDTHLLEKLAAFEVVVIAGQAKSHCVAWTIDDLLEYLQHDAPEVVRKVYLLEDCTSPVVIPGVIDFTEHGDEAFARFRAAGMNVVRSTDPIGTWPGQEDES